MNEAKFNPFYQKIVEKLKETIPQEWTKVLLYGEIDKYSGKTFFYYYPVNDELPVYSHDIPYFTPMTNEQYNELWFELLNLIEDLWHDYKKNNEKPWTTFTFILEIDGTYEVKYGFEDLSKRNDRERQIIWEHKYLGLIPNNEEEKAFLESYLQLNQTN